MSTDRKRHRILAVFLATALGAALSLQLAAPATAAAPQPELTPATGDHLTSRGTVVLGAHGSDGAGIQATITCWIVVSNPFRSGSNIRGSAVVNCTAPVLSIEAAVSLWQAGVAGPVAQDFDATLNAATLTVGDGASCENGNYIVVGAAVIIPPPGYSPWIARIWDESNVVSVTC